MKNASGIFYQKVDKIKGKTLKFRLVKTIIRCNKSGSNEENGTSYVIIRSISLRLTANVKSLETFPVVSCNV